VARTRCGVCAACRQDDCGTCEPCSRKRKFGGDGTSKHACILRRCHEIYGPVPTNSHKTTKPSGTAGLTTTKTTTTTTTTTKQQHSRKSSSSSFSNFIPPQQKGRQRRSNSDRTAKRQAIVGHGGSDQGGYNDSPLSSIQNVEENHGWYLRPPSLLDPAGDVYPITTTMLQKRGVIQQPQQGDPISSGRLLGLRQRLPQSIIMASREENGGTTNTMIATAKTESNPHKKKRSHIYGRAIPSAPKLVCAGCNELGSPEEVVLLCDGPEYVSLFYCQLSCFFCI
jgi:hypothetical protein